MAASLDPIFDKSASETIDAFHRGRFHLVQPVGRGHRAGMDAMMLACLVDDDRPIRIADLGVGAGAAGLAVAARLPKASVVLVERSADMAGFAREPSPLPPASTRSISLKAGRITSST